jgi:alpha-galactosidase
MKQVSILFFTLFLSVTNIAAQQTTIEQAFCKQAVSNYNHLKKVILDGDFYRLVSPYETNHTAVMHVAENRDKAVVFAYDIHPRFKEKYYPVRLQGLNPMTKYRIEEINLMPGVTSKLAENGKIYSGDYLMKVGIDAFTADRLNSKVIELTAVYLKILVLKIV